MTKRQANIRMKKVYELYYSLDPKTDDFEDHLAYVHSETRKLHLFINEMNIKSLKMWLILNTSTRTVPLYLVKLRP